MDFGTMIRVERDKNKISQKELAEKAGIGSGYLCDIERGRKLPSYPVALKLSSSFATSNLLMEQYKKEIERS